MACGQSWACRGRARAFGSELTHAPRRPVFAVFLAAVVTLTITPGSDMIYVASRALGQGRAAGVLSIFGVIAGTFVHLGLALRIALPGNR